MKTSINLTAICILAAALASSAVTAESARDLFIKNHRLYLPSPEGRFPTILAVPGCSGVSLEPPATDVGRPGYQDDVLFRRHYPLMAERFRSEGYAVVLIDVLSGEGVVNACGGEIEAARIAQYITAASDWARNQPFVEVTELYLVGWSMGGGGVLAWLHDPEQSAVRAAITVYPSCRQSKPLAAKIPLLMQLGGSDDIADPKECEKLVANSPAREMIQTQRFEGARHGFDIEAAPEVLDIGDGMTVGYQQKAAETSWAKIIHFLESH